MNMVASAIFVAGLILLFYGVIIFFVIGFIITFIKERIGRITHKFQNNKNRKEKILFHQYM